jgi:hypothetical protein
MYIEDRYIRLISHKHLSVLFIGAYRIGIDNESQYRYFEYIKRKVKNNFRNSEMFQLRALLLLVFIGITLTIVIKLFYSFETIQKCHFGPCMINSNGTYIITKAIFQCAFPLLNVTMLDARFQALKKSEWSPINKDDAAVFLSHVSHETNGLLTYIEYCQKTNCKFISRNR